MSAGDEEKTLRVRAKSERPDQLWVGYYDHKRRRNGDVFTLKPLRRMRLVPTGKMVLGKDGKEIPERKAREILITAEQQFSPRWMEKVEENLPETEPPHFNKTDMGKGTLQNRMKQPEEEVI